MPTLLTPLLAIALVIWSGSAIAETKIFPGRAPVVIASNGKIVGSILGYVDNEVDPLVAIRS